MAIMFGTSSQPHFTSEELRVYNVLAVYLMGTTTFIFIYDKVSGPPGTGINYFLSFYFSFISISTIGLGDVMPNNVTREKKKSDEAIGEDKPHNGSRIVEQQSILTWLENRLLKHEQNSHVVGVINESMKPHSIALVETSTPILQEDQQHDVTTRSVLSFIKSDAHLYDHHFGRINLTTRTDTI
ncbi:hypothetical protein DICVIV_06448 [Dictyocaulus viviparus]|uniref:Potassium channel domain-containing protein n=1 Tax=Dictyocaulus viviparus TaxID=29172 RepID=A0A0D8XYM5_DICVI|nr:hypothetical protein DICVIV_06448 [Dictyocaulus viviparus]